MEFRKYTLKTGKSILLGKNAENNDELVKKYKGKSNIILHTATPGSPFCVMDFEKPSKEEIYESAVVCASKSQDWRENQSDVKVHRFTGKDVKKGLIKKVGTWNVKTFEEIKAKKEDIKKIKWQ